ncbi:MAG: hypothetical protein RIM84_01390 [Alphaproteobacteria bacterium]
MSRLVSTISLVAALAAVPAGHAIAGVDAGQLPAPGIIGLVALGVIGAIAVARHRK